MHPLLMGHRVLRVYSSPDGGALSRPWDLEGLDYPKDGAMVTLAEPH